MLCDEKIRGGNGEKSEAVNVNVNVNVDRTLRR